MTDVSTAMSTTPSWPAEPETGDDQAPGAPNSSRTLETSATVLDRLESAGWRTLHNRLTPGSLMVIDHVAIGPGGIFVIDSHSSAKSAADVSVISDPDQPAKISAAQAVADSVRALLPPLTRQYVVSVVAYADTSPMSLSRGPIQICTTAMLEGLIASRHQVLGASEIADIVTNLDSALSPAGDGPRPAARRSTPSPVQADTAAAADLDAPGKSGDTRRGRRFLGRRGSKAAAAGAANAPDITPAVVEYPGSTAPPSPYPFVSPPVAAVRGTTESATDPEAAVDPEVEVVAPQTYPVAESQPQVTEPAAELVESETYPVAESQPQVTEPAAELVESETYPVAESQPQVIEPEAELVESETLWVAEAGAHLIEPAAIEPAAIEVEPEVDFVEPEISPVAEYQPQVIEPETIASSVTDFASRSYDDVPLVDYFRDLRATDRAVPGLVGVDAEDSIPEDSIPEHSIPADSIPEADAITLEAHIAEPEVEHDAFGYRADLGYDHLVARPDVSPDGDAEADPGADLEAVAQPEDDGDTATTTAPDEPSWEELSIEDLHTDADGDMTDVDILSPPASSLVDAAPIDIEPPSPSQPIRQPGGRRKAPVKPWHHLVSGKATNPEPRRARQLTTTGESEEVPEVAVQQEPAAIVEQTTPKAFSFVDPTETRADSPEPVEATVDAALTPSSSDIEIEADHHQGLHVSISPLDIAPAEHLDPEGVGWSIDHQTDLPWTPAPTIAPPAEVPAFASTSAASPWDTGLSVAVSRWKAARLGQSSNSIEAHPADVEPESVSDSADAATSRKQHVAAAPTASMPAGLSRRGQKMYAAMNGPGASDATLETDESVPPRRTVRKLFVFALIAGLLVFSSLQYNAISKWVSDHVDLPGIGGSQGDPPKGGKNPDNDKSTKPEAEKDDAKASSAVNR